VFGTPQRGHHPDDNKGIDQEPNGDELQNNHRRVPSFKLDAINDVKHLRRHLALAFHDEFGTAFADIAALGEIERGLDGPDAGDGLTEIAKALGMAPNNCSDFAKSRQMFGLFVCLAGVMRD
jgi:hypothetical protein